MVVPSFLFHCFTYRGGPSWDSVFEANEEGQRHYWASIRARYGEIGGGRALIVLHHSFTADNPSSRTLLSTLAEQPADFASRVVIASLESSLGHFVIAPPPKRAASNQATNDGISRAANAAERKARRKRKWEAAHPGQVYRERQGKPRGPKQ